MIGRDSTEPGFEDSGIFSSFLLWCVAAWPVHGLFAAPAPARSEKAEASEHVCAGDFMPDAPWMPDPRSKQDPCFLSVCLSVYLSVCYEMKTKSVNEMKIHGCRGKPAQGSACDSLNYQTLFSLLVTPHNPH